MKKLPKPIRTESFTEAWEYVSAKYRYAKRRVGIEKVASLVGNYLFLFLALLLCYGGIYQQNIPQLTAFMEKMTWLLEPWQVTQQLLAQSGLSGRDQLVLCACALYLIPLAVCAVLTLLVLVVYHPKKPLPPEGTEAQKAQALLQLGKDARKYARRSSGTATTCTILFIVALALFISCFLLDGLISETSMDLVQGMGGNLIMIFTVGATVIIFVYAAVNYILLLLLKLLHYCHIPKTMIPALEDYCSLCAQHEEIFEAISDEVPEAKETL